jgi:hypothetical protein
MSILASVSARRREQAEEKEQWRGGRRRRHAGDVEHDGAAGLPGIGGALVADPVGQDGNAAVQNADLVACNPKDRRLPLGRTGGPALVLRSRPGNVLPGVSRGHPIRPSRIEVANGTASFRTAPHPMSG